jgi:YD repeat-containing protein
MIRKRTLTGLIFLLVFLAGLVSTLSAQSNTPVQYFYDDLGRLAKVVDQNGNVATYNYDAVGNLLSITRATLPGGNGLAILSFMPQQGPVGATVTIQGQGFSATPSADAVQFNGTAATVTVATANTLTVTVPPGGTTGPISVTVGAATATSQSNFTVTTLVSITVTPATSTIGIGASQQFRAVGTYNNGTTRDLTTLVTWGSSNTTIATISNAAGSQGVLTSGTSLGSATLSAAFGSLSGSTTVQVISLISITITPAAPGLLRGGTQQFMARGTNTDGSTVDLTSVVFWNSSNTGIVTISNAASSKGIATGVAPGIATISAASGTISGQITLSVSGLGAVFLSPPNPSVLVGQALRLSATAVFSDNTSQQTTRDVTAAATWTSSDLTMATVSNSPGTQGVIVGVHGGTPNICASYTATGVTINGCSPVTVVPVLQSLAVNPANPSVPKGGTRQLIATGSYNDGSTQDLTTSVSWSSSNSTAATISNQAGTQGLATAISLGTTTVTATTGSFVGSTNMTVVAPVPVSIIVSPASSGIAQGSTLQFRANSVLSDGSLGSDVTATTNWASSDSTVASISNATGSQGLATGVAPGVVTISAASGTFTASATLIVSSTTSSTVPRFAFVANTTDDTISLYTVNAATGQLSANGYVVEAAGSKPTAVALDPASKFLFVANSGTNNVAVYVVAASNGTITSVAGSPFSAGFRPNSVIVDPSANFVYVVNSRDNTVSGFAFDSVSGALTAVPGSPFPVGTGPNSAAVDGTGQFLYVTNSIDGTISAFTISSNSGALTPVTGAPFPAGTGPLGVMIDPSNKFVLVANGQASGGPPVSQLFRPNSGKDRSTTSATRRSTGPKVIAAAYSRIEENSGASRGPGPAGLALAADPLVFALPQSGGGIGTNKGVSVFAIDRVSGALTPVPGSPFVTAGTSPNSVAVDPSDKFVFATDATGGLSVFTISASSGVLSLLPGSPYTTNFSSTSVVVDPSGLFVYVTDNGSDDLTVFGIDPSTGGLISLGHFPARNGPAAIAISKGATPVAYLPRFAYVADSGSAAPAGGTPGSNNLFGYSIDPNAGGLASVSGSPFPEGFFPEFATTDPLGRFLYVANNCSDPACSAAAGSVSAYSIDQAAGSLVAAPGSPFLAGTAPLGAVVDPSGRFAYVVNSKDFTISGYSADPSTGALSPIVGSPFSVAGGTAASLAMALTLDPTGQFLYVLTACPNNSCNAGILVFSISPSFGALTPTSSNSFASGVAPSSLIVEPRGGFLYVPDAASGRVFAFSISSITGVLSPISGTFSTAGSGSGAAAVHPTGSFFYVTNANSNSVSAFTIATGSGTLTPVPGSPFTVGAMPVSLNVDASGEFLLVVNEGDNTVSVFTINLQTGALAPVTGSPFPAGTVPVSITTTGKIQ